jgi:spore germination cell wall hydrolase CwlJ-like protein
MNIISILAICSALMTGSLEFEQKGCPRAVQTYQTTLKTLTLSENDKEAIARVSYAEAATQGEAGLAGVVYTILNRLISGEFGKTITQIVNAKHQFEPVQRVGGWQNLPIATDTQKAKINTIITLALEGHLPDVTKGALFFQNPKIVTMRETKGTVSKGLTHFGGSKPSSVIKDHAFYHTINGKQHPPPKEKMVTLKQTLKKITPKKHQPYDVFTKQETAHITDIFVSQTAQKTLLLSVQ